MYGQPTFIIKKPKIKTHTHRLGRVAIGAESGNYIVYMYLPERVVKEMHSPGCRLRRGLNSVFLTESHFSSRRS